VLLISPVGVDDVLGKVLGLEMRNTGLREDGLFEVERGRTGSCTLVLEKDGDLVGGVADMGIVEALTPDMVGSLRD
jgi:pseudouridine-5'-phosphate glycosidase/pseudouridine kinase